jgi:hypothetical protein
LGLSTIGNQPALVMAPSTRRTAADCGMALRRRSRAGR